MTDAPAPLCLLQISIEGSGLPSSSATPPSADEMAAHDTAMAAASAAVCDDEVSTTLRFLPFVDVVSFEGRGLVCGSLGLASHRLLVRACPPFH